MGLSWTFLYYVHPIILLSLLFHIVFSCRAKFEINIFHFIFVFVFSYMLYVVLLFAQFLHVLYMLNIGSHSNIMKFSFYFKIFFVQWSKKKKKKRKESSPHNWQNLFLYQLIKHDLSSKGQCWWTLLAS